MKKLKGVLAAVCGCSLISGGLSGANNQIRKIPMEKSYTYSRSRSKKFYETEVYDNNLQHIKEVESKKHLEDYKKQKIDLAKKIVGYGALSATGVGTVTLAKNQWMNLDALYKIADENGKMQTGKGSSSVGEYEYRDESKKDKKLVIKKIDYLSPGILAFGSEKMAKKAISNLTGNENMLGHFAKVRDCHCGLISTFIVYDKANRYDWKKDMLDNKWSDDEKAKWLAEVFNQVLDCSEFLYSNGLLHGDLVCHNYNVDNVDGKPYIRIFDYGLLHKVKENPFFRHSLNWELEKILKGFIISYCYYFNLGGVDSLSSSGFFDLIENQSIEDYNFKLLVGMYKSVRNTFKRLSAPLGSRLIGMRHNFSDKEFKDLIDTLRTIIEQMPNEFNNQ